MLYENEGLTDDLFRVFLVYVASSRRPMHELLAPAKALEHDGYDTDFAGMARSGASPEALLETSQRLQADIRSRLTGEVADFLLSLHDAEPDFDLIGLAQAVDLPAVRWKLVNLERLRQSDPAKHMAQREALKRLFQSGKTERCVFSVLDSVRTFKRYGKRTVHGSRPWRVSIEDASE